MSREEIKELVYRWFEKINSGKEVAIAVIDEFYVTDYIAHGGTGEDLNGVEEFKQSISDFFSAFPDAHWSIDDMVVEGNKIAVRFTMSGTHKGDIVGVPAIDKKWKTWGIYIHHIVDGKFAESWTRYNSLGFFHQLWGLSTPSNK